MIVSVQWWTPEREAMSPDQRRDDLLRRMLSMPPAHNKQYVGGSLRLPRSRKRKRDNTKPLGFKHTIPSDSLLARIEAAVPPMRPEWREEIVQDIALAIVSGEADEGVLNDLEALAKFRRKAIARFSSHWRFVSTDEPVSGDDDRRLIDVLADETEAPDEYEEFT